MVVAAKERLTGRLLIASPSLEDPNFSRTVVLMLAHTEEGALGVILNRPSPAHISEILPQWKALAGEPAQVFRGGPVSINSAICLGMPTPTGLVDLPDGVEPTVAGLVSVDLERDPDDVASALVGLRVYSGYAGWDEGQLEGELEAGGWISAEPLPHELLTEFPDELWATVLRRLGGLRSAYVNAPPRLSMN